MQMRQGLQAFAGRLPRGFSRKRMEYNYVWNRRRREHSARQSADL